MSYAQKIQILDDIMGPKMERMPNQHYVDGSGHIVSKSGMIGAFVVWSGKGVQG